MTYSEAKAFLKAASERGSILGLERVRELLRLLGQPQEKVKTVHISGTNGKGSFGAMLTAVLTEAGYKTGGFSSPAITDVTDSCRINGTEITQERFADIIGIIAPVCDSMTEKPTEFEVLAAAAYVLFAEEKCDIAVVECGMGGDTDATNVMESPVLSVITNVQSDHCGFLGNTIAEIAAHKAGIIKKGCPVFFGDTAPVALEIIEKRAKEMSAPLTVIDRSGVTDVKYSLEGISFRRNGREFATPLCGSYQLGNTLNVLQCAEILGKNGFPVSESALKNGLLKTKWHGRFEILSRDPYVIFDGAHNPDGIHFAADTISRYFDKKAAILIGVMADKEYGLYADMLGHLIDKAFTVKPDNPRALDSAALAEVFTAKGIPSESFEVLTDGVRSAYSYAKEKNIPLIALGSLYMYREFTQALMELRM
ncbi:MAG: bifunctional folylpolyglutamate synthase/dihydrofolate synthase [Ruminococcus sp.]|nr:bifunctional folylpolyglutamate synthase/dihydrofolate synthase [Ruminococcus sp.]